MNEASIHCKLFRKLLQRSRGHLDRGTLTQVSSALPAAATVIRNYSPTRHTPSQEQAPREGIQGLQEENGPPPTEPSYTHFSRLVERDPRARPVSPFERLIRPVDSNIGIIGVLNFSPKQRPGWRSRSQITEVIQEVPQRLAYAVSMNLDGPSPGESAQILRRVREDLDALCATVPHRRGIFWTSFKRWLSSQRWIASPADKNLGIAIVPMVDLYAKEELLHGSATFTRIGNVPTFGDVPTSHSSARRPNQDTSFLDGALFWLVQSFNRRMWMHDSAGDVDVDTWNLFMHRYRIGSQSVHTVKLPKFYGMPKIHKAPYKIRPIFAAPKWVTTPLSLAIHTHLQGYLDLLSAKEER